MVTVIFNAIVTVALGIGVAVGVFWLLNKLAELLPDALEHRLKPFLYILPAYFAIIVYLIYPTVLTVIYSFKDRFSKNWVGFQNYTDLFQSPGFWSNTIFNTFLWMLVVPSLSVVFGLIIATLADRLGPTGEKLTKTLIFLPMAISMVGAATVWSYIYTYRAVESGQEQIGLLNSILVNIFHVEPVAWLSTDTWHLNSFMLMLIMLWAQVGFSMVLLSAAVKGVPTETLEAARIDGATELQIFFQVIVPQIKGTIITVLITVTIGVMKVFDIVYATTGGQFRTNVIGNEFFTQFTTNFHSGKAAAIVVMLMVAVIPIMFYQVRHFKAEEANA
ncbi:MAG: sugar ABC transporter permease [Nocardioides sp.]